MEASGSTPLEEPAADVDVAEWTEKVESYHLPRAEADKLIMEYLVKEGFKDAVLAFQKESGIDPGVDMKILDEQIKIREAVGSGSIQDAVELVNDVDPEILDTNPKLFFHLQQQQLLEYIRQGNVEKVLDYAQKELSARGEENPEFLEELEQTLSLLAFDNTSASPFSELLEHSQRLKVMSEVNAAVLASQDQSSESKLGLLMKLVVWTQDELTKSGHKFPKLTDFTSCKLHMDK